MNLKFLTAAAVLSTALAAPALAQDSHGRSDAVRQTPQQERMHQGRVQHDRMVQRQSGFWPADAAAGVVGGAIGAAGAIATAPFRNDVYAYNDGYYGQGSYGQGSYGQSYYGGYNNGFVCQPGTTFIGQDGLRHICQ